MKKKMSEKQVWLKVATHFSKGKRCRCMATCGLIKYRNAEHKGLCAAINGYGGQDDAMKEIMRAKVKRLMPKKLGGFVWPTNGQGARSRAAFCRKQARLLSKGKKK